ncbi:MAG: Nif3-like dinuclear metal center hexameric protein [Prevotellaceae bacterium]|nr:Nif3-like dinuclear metal center hexameric protein [Candidatus Minthosoma caballi]
MKIRQITTALEEFAPLALQDGYDNAGLQIGLAEDADATGALLCLDVTEAVVDEAIELGCNLIVSHHPLLFRPMKSISGRDYIERTVIKAIKHDITIYSAHTNLDSAEHGVNYKIAEKLNLQSLQWLNPKGESAGEGIIGLLPKPLPKKEFIGIVKDVFNLSSLRCNDWQGEMVTTVALCGGSGAFLIPKAIEKGADTFLTGEIGYHRFFGYEQDILLLELGHFESEQYTSEILQSVISKAAPSLAIHKSAIPTNPILYL